MVVYTPDLLVGLMELFQAESNVHFLKILKEFDKTVMKLLVGTCSCLVVTFAVDLIKTFF